MRGVDGAAAKSEQSRLRVYGIIGGFLQISFPGADDELGDRWLAQLAEG